jgi:putative ABC transport system permease protein
VFRLSVEPASLFTGALIGFVISAVTVWATSARISSLNVIRAIRDVPEPKTSRTRLRSLVLGVAGIAVGLMIFVAGGEGSPIAALVGPSVAMFSAIPVLSRIVPSRVAVIGASVAALVWGIAAFSVMAETFDDPEIFVFIFQGVILVAAAVAILSQADHLWVVLADRLSRSGQGLASRLGLAYPLDRKFRTGMLLSMFAIVIFTMMFLSVFGTLFARQAPRLTDEARAGFDIAVSSIPFNPVSDAELESQPGVSDAVALVRSNPEFTDAGHPEPEPWPMTGFDEGFLAHGGPVLTERADRYPTDRATLEAVLSDPSLAIVSEWHLGGEGPPEASLEPGDRLTVTNPASGEERTLTVAGPSCSTASSSARPSPGS